MLSPKTFSTQQDMFDYADKHNFIFYVSKDIAYSPTESTKEFLTFKNINSFLTYYNTLDNKSKNYYEMVRLDSTFYMYFDLDLKLDENNKHFTNEDLFFWFEDQYKQFLSTVCNKIIRTKWIITTASNESKISLHLLNTESIFNKTQTFKRFYALFKEYISKNVPTNHPFIKSIDWCVCSNNRAMRIIHSSKMFTNRPFKIWHDYHLRYVDPIETFITNAINDPLIEQKLIKIDENETPIENKNEYKTPIKNKHNSNIQNLLTILDKDMVDEYENWIIITMALKHSGYDIDTLKNWSKQSSKYKEKECEKIWNSISNQNKEKVYNIYSLYKLAKKHNPEQYYQFIKQSQSIDIPFTHNLQINERFIPEQFYNQYLQNYDIIALKSNMFTGKTYSMPSLFNTHKNIVVIYHRISLNKAIFDKWQTYGFELYSDIKSHSIKLSEHNRVIIQLDSIHRLLGKCDLLILDELESTSEHLCSSPFITKTHECAKQLLSYIKHSPKTIICDANLQDTTIQNFVPQNKSIIRIENTFKSFQTTNCNIYSNFDQSINKLIELIKQNKKVVIPTNSKKKAKVIKHILHKNNPQLNIYYTDSDHKTKDFNWQHYDVIIYTPTITAGVSFDLTHFHTVFAFFNRNSCSAESASQMLFRVRKLIDNEINIYCDHDLQTNGKPTDDNSIKDYVNNLISMGHSHLKLDGLDIDSFNMKVQETQYYNIFKDYVKKSHLSFNLFTTYLVTILKNHGINIYFKHLDIEAKRLQEIKNEIKQEQMNVTNEEIQNIANASYMDELEYKQCLTNSINIDTTDKYRMKRYNICKTFDIPQTTKLEPDFIKDKIKYIKGYKNFKFYKDYTIDECIHMLEEEFQEKYSNLIIETNENIKNNKRFKHIHGIETSSEEEISSDEDNNTKDEEFVFEKEYRIKRKYLQKKNVNDIVHSSIHYKKEELKLIQCFKILKEAGYTTLSDTAKIKLDYSVLHNYCKQNELNIRTLFDSKIMDWKEEIDGNEKKSLMNYINQKLESLLAVRISPTSKGSQSYVILPLVKVEE